MRLSAKIVAGRLRAAVGTEPWFEHDGKGRTGLSYRVDARKHFRVECIWSDHKLNTFLEVDNREISDVVVEAGLRVQKRWPWVFQRGKAVFIPEARWEHYRLVGDEATVAAKLAEVAKDIRELYVPVAKDLTVRYEDALGRFDDRRFLAGLEHPMTIGAILAFLAKREDWIYDVLVRSTPCLTEFREHWGARADLERDLITPIRRWFEARDPRDAPPRARRRAGARTHLAREMAKSFPARLRVPAELRALCRWAEREGDEMSGRFRLLPNADFALSWFGPGDAAGRLGAFGRGPDGSIYAVWKDDAGKSKVVHLGSEDDRCFVLAHSFKDFLRLLAIGYDELGFADITKPPHEEKARRNPRFVAWVESTFQTTIPKVGREISHPSDPSFEAWITRARDAQARRS